MRDARQALGLSQEDIAEAAGCSRVHIGLIESGQRTPSLELLCKIAEALKTSAGFLLGEEANHVS